MILSRDIPGQEFVMGFLLLPLSWDKGTVQWDKETFLSQDIGTTGCPAGRPVSWEPWLETIEVWKIYQF